MFVAKIHSRHNLPEETPCLSFWESPLSNKVIKEFASRNVLQNKVSADNRAIHTQRDCVNYVWTIVC